MKREVCPHLKLLGFLKPLSGFPDGVFQEETVREVSGDAGRLLSSRAESLYGVWRSVVGSETQNDALQATNLGHNNSL